MADLIAAKDWSTTPLGPMDRRRWRSRGIARTSPGTDAPAWHSARELRPDVIFCDIGLPDIDGFEVARTIRNDAALAGVRLIALTGYAQPEDLAHATAAGFDFHVAKPADLQKVYRLLR